MNFKFLKHLGFEIFFLFFSEASEIFEMLNSCN